MSRMDPPLSPFFPPPEGDGVTGAFKQATGPVRVASCNKYIYFYIIYKNVNYITCNFTLICLPVINELFRFK